MRKQGIDRTRALIGSRHLRGIFLMLIVFGSLKLKADARAFLLPSYADLTTKADVIAICEPISEKNVTTSYVNGSPDFKYLETTFKIDVLYKGMVVGNSLKLIHGSPDYHLPDGPLFMTFFNDHAPVAPYWLLFLKSRSDDKFEPVTENDDALSFKKVRDAFP